MTVHILIVTNRPIASGMVLTVQAVSPFLVEATIILAVLAVWPNLVLLPSMERSKGMGS